MNTGIAFARKMSAAYTAVCKPLCQSLHLPQTAFDILMFLGNNPEYSTARDIVEVRQNLGLFLKFCPAAAIHFFFISICS